MSAEASLANGRSQPPNLKKQCTSGNRTESMPASQRLAFADRQGINGTILLSRDLHQVTGFERSAQRHDDARHEVGSNVLERNPPVLRVARAALIKLC